MAVPGPLQPLLALDPLPVLGVELVDGGEVRAVGPGLLAADKEEGVTVGHGGGVGEEVLVGDHGAEGPGVGGQVVDLGGRGGDAAGAGKEGGQSGLF